MAADFQIDEDIRAASTLPGRFYSDPAIFQALRERVFAKSWQQIGDTARLAAPGKVCPTSFLEGILDEPLLLTRDAGDRLHCVSNVCTHRGNIVCDAEGVEQALRCRYHGRRFALDGRFLSMPEFEEAKGFPSERDSLRAVELGSFGKLLFAALAPAFPFAELIAPLQARLGWVPFERAVFEPSRSRDYTVKANWALYCDNYLEGFHIPFVHAALNQAVDYAAYRTELFQWSSLQIGPGLDCFELPRSSPDHGQSIAGYYFFLFPNTMLNFYPWGISINRVMPLAPDRTRIRYLTWIWNRARLGQGAGGDLDRVEREDEAVVESVQRGIGSRLYDRGRYSPSRETGVHHFHRLLARFL